MDLQQSHMLTGLVKHAQLACLLCANSALGGFGHWQR
jgi:hypothetical protein